MKKIEKQLWFFDINLKEKDFLHSLKLILLQKFRFEGMVY